MDIHIVTKKHTNIPDKTGMVRTKYVFTIKNFNIHNEMDSVEIYYVIRTIKDGSKNLSGSVMVNNFNDIMNIDLSKTYTSTLDNIICERFIQYANENKLYGFDEFERFIEIKN